MSKNIFHLSHTHTPTAHSFPHFFERGVLHAYVHQNETH
jgi:hypothetical protein